MAFVFRTYALHVATFVRHHLLLASSLLAVGYLASCTQHEEVSSRSQIAFDFAPQTPQSPTPATRQGVKADTWMDHVTHTLPIHDAQGDSVMQVLVLSQDMADSIAPQTRAGAVTTNTMYPSFGVLTYAYPATGSWNETLRPNFMYNVEVTSASRYTTSYYWPGAEEKLSFFAYAPYNGTGIVLSGQTTAGTPKMTYTVPDAVASQKDVVVAVSKDVNGNKRAIEQLRFKHVLTAVRVKTAANVLPGRITSVKLKNVYGKAVYTMGATSWSGHDTKKTFSQTMNKAVGATAQNLVQGETTFMMLPQTLPADAALEVTYQDDFSRREHTLSASIANQVWEMGKVKTYQLSLSSLFVDYTLSWSNWTSDVNPVVPPATGATHGFNVVSKKRLMRRGNPNTVVYETDHPFEVVWSPDNDNATYTATAPNWVTATKGNFTNGSSRVTINVAAQPKVSFDEMLRNTPAITGTKDLSMGNPNTTGRTTANCYMVHAPGQYSFPVVYGNSLRNGGTNEGAYKDGLGTDGAELWGSGAYRLNPMHRHDNSAITGPYLVDNGVNPHQAKLVWQDAAGLVSDITLSSDKRTLTFRVNAATIKQGNAVIAVVNSSNTILWSWHIWVTPEQTKSQTATVGQETLLDPPLGWRDIDGGYRSHRQTYVRIRHAERPNYYYSREFEQTEATQFSTTGSALYYQFGRKDPFVPSNVSTENPTWSVNGEVRDGIKIGEAIQNPYKWFIRTDRDNNWLIRKYNNLWNMNITWNTRGTYDSGNNTNRPRKTVYDPSPVGYVVAPPGIWSSNTAARDKYVMGYINTADRTRKISTGAEMWSSDFKQADRRQGNPFAISSGRVAERDQKDALIVRSIREQ